MTIKFIGIKDTDDNDIGIITRKKPIPKDFWDNYEFKNVFWLVGGSSARLIVTKI